VSRPTEAELVAAIRGLVEHADDLHGLLVAERTFPKGSGLPTGADILLGGLSLRDVNERLGGARRRAVDLLSRLGEPDRPEPPWTCPLIDALIAGAKASGFEELPALVWGARTYSNVEEALEALRDANWSLRECYTREFDHTETVETERNVALDEVERLTKLLEAKDRDHARAVEDLEAENRREIDQRDEEIATLRLLVAGQTTLDV
jgi:hypothetical protein